MSKATRSKAQNAAKKQRQEEKLKKERKNKRIETAIALSCVGAIVLATGGAFVANKIHENYLDSGEGLRKVVAMSTENYAVDNAMLTYFVYNDYYYYVNYYGDNASYYGIDESLSLSEQYYNESSGVTWLDYCTEEAVDNLESMLILCEGAKANNFTLTDAENNEISTMLETVTPSEYGRGVNTEDIRKCLEISYLASKYQDSLKENISITDDEIETYYNENAKDYQTSQYISFDIDYIDPDDEEATGVTETDAEEYVNTLKSCKTEEEFKNAVSNYLEGAYTEITEDEITETVDGITAQSLTYTAEEDLSEWAFDSARVVGDTMSVLNEDDNCYTVYMLTSLPVRDEENVVDVRHILFNFEDYEDEDEALADAEGVLKEYRSGDMTEESFATLATEYSSDTGSASNGGLYEGVYKGQMVENFENWCFDEARKTGDVDIVETEYGYHIMYFVEKGEAKYKYDIREMLENDKFDAVFAEYQNAYAITMNNDAINEITGKEVTESTVSE